MAGRQQTSGPRRERPAPGGAGFWPHDGIVTVKVCTSIEHGQPVGVFAEHVQPPRVHIDPTVRLVKTATHHYTAQVVDVTRGGGPVIIRPRRRSLDSRPSCVAAHRHDVEQAHRETERHYAAPVTAQGGRSRDAARMSAVAPTLRATLLADGGRTQAGGRARRG